MPIMSIWGQKPVNGKSFTFSVIIKNPCEIKLCMYVYIIYQPFLWLIQEKGESKGILRKRLMAAGRMNH